MFITSKLVKSNKVLLNNHYKIARRQFCFIDKKEPPISKYKNIFKNSNLHYKIRSLKDKLEPPKDFDELDSRDIKWMSQKTLYDTRYLNVIKDWQKPLERKIIKRERNADSYAKFVY